ncbi:MAG TPA: YraN family protein, partial [Stellaceae bacterium]|nr:YraN family protein [Stellaceae bacterium]
MTTAAKRRAFRRGQLAELLCLWHLRLRGYRILARRFRVPTGEIDLIARRGGVVAAIEVKARSNVAAAGEAVSHRQ